MTEARGRRHTGKSRLPAEVEAIIRWVVDDALARGGRASTTELHRHICWLIGRETRAGKTGTHLPFPSRSTVAHRREDATRQVFLRSRMGTRGSGR